METSHSQAAWLTRRAFLGTAAGLAASAYVLPLMPSGSPAVPTAWAATDFKLRAPEPNPKYGGVLRYGITSTPPHFDIHQSGTVNNMATQGCMYDNLIRRNPLDSGQTIIPDLAHSWEIAPDGKTYTFFLRKGVKFHDGADFTAEDVKATYARIVWPPEGVSIPRTPLFATVSEINVRDAHTIEFKLHEPRPASFMLAAFACGWNVIVRKQTLEDNNYNLRRVMNYPGTGRSGTSSASIKKSGSWKRTATTGTKACPTLTASSFTILLASPLNWGRRSWRGASTMAVCLTP